uniref:Uncharacterized protein n=1 Tax=Anguilla anguilla TaxID=7936 RepID=A0A0E9PHN9_ANGAN
MTPLLYSILHGNHFVGVLIQSDLQKWRTLELVAGIQKCDIHKKAMKAHL